MNIEFKKTVEESRMLNPMKDFSPDTHTIEFRIVWDADQLLNIANEFAHIDKERLREIIDRTFKTETGHKIAMEKFVDSNEQKDG